MKPCHPRYHLIINNTWSVIASINEIPIEQCLNFVEEESSLGTYCTICYRQEWARGDDSFKPTPQQMFAWPRLRGRLELGGGFPCYTNRQMASWKLPDSIPEAKQGTELGCPLSLSLHLHPGSWAGPREGALDKQRRPGAWAATPASSHTQFSCSPLL